MEVKKEIEEVKEESLAMTLINDLKAQYKKLFIIWILTFTAFIGLLGYTIYLLNDISVVETSEQEITDIDSIENSNITNGDIYGEN